VHELTDGGENRGDLLVMLGELLVEPSLELRESSGQLPVGSSDFINDADPPRQSLAGVSEGVKLLASAVRDQSSRFDQWIEFPSDDQRWPCFRALHCGSLPSAR
jgi:hypothetical protein